MTVQALSARMGYAGFRAKLPDVETCLQDAAKKHRFSEAAPWPCLPMYARWPVARTEPTGGTDVVAFLRTAVFQIPYPPAGDAGTFVF